VNELMRRKAELLEATSKLRSRSKRA